MSSMVSGWSRRTSASSCSAPGVWRSRSIQIRRSAASAARISAGSVVVTSLSPSRMRACIGRSTFPCSLNKFPYDPRTNRARGFPAHGFREGSRLATRHSLRILHGATQAMEAEVVEEVARPLRRLARRQLTPRALDAQAAEPLVDVRVDLLEVASGVPGAEVSPPSTEDRVEVCDHLAEIRVASPSWRHAPHLFSHPLHRAPTRPAMQEVHSLSRALPDLAAQALVQVTAEEVEALLSVVELDSPRLLGMQLQAQPCQDRLDPVLGLLALLLRFAHHHQIVGVAHQRSERSTVPRPQRVEDVQVDVRQEWRDHPSLRNARVHRAH